MQIHPYIHRVQQPRILETIHSLDLATLDVVVMDGYDCTNWILGYQGHGGIRRWLCY